MDQQFTIDRRRLAITLAIAAPIAIALGLALGEWHWRRQGGITLPEMCITAEPNGETSVSLGACQDPLTET